MKKYKISQKIILFFLVLNLACSVKAKSLNIAVPRYHPVAMPKDATKLIDFYVFADIYQTLITYDKSGSLTGSLAKSWEVTKNLTEYCFILDPSATFSDGTKVTANDVIYSFSSRFWPSIESENQILKKILVGASKVKRGERIEGIVAKSEDQVCFRIYKPYLPFLSLMSSPRWSILKKNSDRNRSPIGSGPLTYKIFNDRIELYPREKRDDQVTKITIVSADSETMFEHNKLNERYDCVWYSPKVKDSLMSGLVTNEGWNSGILHLFFNFELPLFSDENIRKKFAMAFRSEFLKLKPNLQSYEVTHNFIPYGIMPESYYTKKSHAPVSIQEFSELWVKKHRSTVIKIMLPLPFYNEHDLFKLEKKFKDYGVSIRFISLKEKTTPHLLLSGYQGLFPDPDGYLSLIHPGAKNRPGKIRTETLFSKLEEFKFEKSRVRRLKKYRDVLRDFEMEFQFIPLYTFRAPFYCKKGIAIPRAGFRYFMKFSEFKYFTK